MGSSVLTLGMALVAQAASGDTVVVRAVNPFSGVTELSAIEELRIGSLDGPEETSFGYIDPIAVGRDGTVYIPDIQVPTIRMFDSGGEYLGDLGRKGEGPGEYIAIRGIAALSGGGVAVWHEMGDITVFDGDRQFVRLFSAQLAAIAGGTGPGLVADTSDNLFVRTTVRLPSSRARVIRYAWVHYSIKGEFIDSIVPPDRNLEGSPFAFRTETFSAPSPHGYFWTGRTNDYAIHRPLRDGRVLRIEREYEPIPIQGEERSQWMRYVAEVEARRSEQFPQIHRTKPAWRQFHVADDGRLWVLRYSQAEHVPGNETRSSIVGDFPTIEWVEPQRYDVLGPRGSFLGSVVLPYEATILAARGKFVWTLERGEYDEAYVVRYRIDGLPGAA